MNKAIYFLVLLQNGDFCHAGGYLGGKELVILLFILVVSCSLVLSFFQPGLWVGIWNIIVCGVSKTFVRFVNKIKSTNAISLKLPYVRNQFNTNKHGNVQTNRLLNFVVMTICSLRVGAIWNTPRR